MGFLSMVRLLPAQTYSLTDADRRLFQQDIPFDQLCMKRGNLFYFLAARIPWRDDSCRFADSISYIRLSASSLPVSVS